jgi:hypothetical protein
MVIVSSVGREVGYTMGLLKLVAAEEAQKLYGYSFKRISRCVSLCRVENGSAYVAAKDIWVIEV